MYVICITVAQDTPKEFVAFMEFYYPLTKTLWGYADELCKGFHKDLVITSSEEERIMNSPRSHRIGVLLSTLAMKLRHGNTTLFSKVLKRIQLYKNDVDIQQIALKMQEKFQALNDNKYGMYLWVVYNFWTGPIKPDWTKGINFGMGCGPDC